MDHLFEALRPLVATQFLLWTTKSVSVNISSDTNDFHHLSPSERLGHSDTSTRLLYSYYSLIILPLLSVAVANFLKKANISSKPWSIPTGSRRSILNLCYTHNPRTNLKNDVRTPGSEKTPVTDFESRPGPPCLCPPPLPHCYRSKEQRDPDLCNAEDHQSWLNHLVCQIHSALVYQPRSTPRLHWNLPSNGYTVVVVCFVSLNLYYVLFPGRDGELGLLDRCELLFAANLPILYLFTAVTQPLHTITGISREFLGFFRRRLANVVALHGFVHTVGISFLCMSRMYLGFQKDNLLMGSLAALLAYGMLLLVGTLDHRIASYSMLSPLLHIAAITILFLTQDEGKMCFAAAFTIYLLDQLAHIVSSPVLTEGATMRVVENEETMRLSFYYPIRSAGRIRSCKGFLNFLPAARGLWLVNIPELRQIGTIEIVASSTTPDSLPITSCSRLDLTVYPHQDSWARLRDLAMEKQLLSIRLQHHYTTPHITSELDNTDLTILVAGGKGIATAWPLAQYLLRMSSDLGILPPRRPVVVLVWVIRSSKHLSWIGRQALAALEYQGAIINVPRATNEIGRPDLDYIINDYVRCYARPSNGCIGIMASGPPGLCRTVRNNASNLIRTGKKVRLTIESFRSLGH